MHKFYLLIIGLVFVLSACGGNPTALNGGDGSGNQGQENTDTRTCSGTATTLNIFATWKKTYASNVDTEELKYQIQSNNQTLITRTCTFTPSNVQVVAMISVASSVLNNNTNAVRYAIGDTRTYTNTQTVNGTTYSCTVSVQAINYIPVIFTGPCMGFVAGGNASYFLPSL